MHVITRDWMSMAATVISCTRSGRVKKRATPTEGMVVRIFRETGATVRPNVFLRDMNVDVSAADRRDVEVLA